MTLPRPPQRARTLLLAACALAGGAAVACDTGTDAAEGGNDAGLDLDGAQGSTDAQGYDGSGLLDAGSYDSADASDDAPTDAPTDTADADQ